MTTISNIPASINWKIYKGDTAKLTIFMQDENGVDIDLTGYEFTGVIKTNQDDSVPLQGLAIASNAALLSLTIQDTEVLPKISYFDVQSVKDEVIWTIIKGTISVEQDVTN